MFFKNKKSFSSLVEILRELGNKFLQGKSTADDLIKWEEGLNNLNTILENKHDRVIFRDEIKRIFYEYLLKHYPSDKRLVEVYENIENINDARKSLYKEMILNSLAESLHLLENNSIKELVNEYLYFEEERKDIAILTTKGNKCTEKDLLNTIRKVRKYVPTKTKEQINWHSQIDGLGTFVVSR